MKKLDPIVIKEKLTRTTDSLNKQNKIRDSLLAQLWLNEHCFDEFIAFELKIIPYSTANVDKARPYIMRAFAEYYGYIVQRAIDLAEFDEKPI